MECSATMKMVCGVWGKRKRERSGVGEQNWISNGLCVYGRLQRLFKEGRWIDMDPAFGWLRSLQRQLLLACLY